MTCTQGESLPISDAGIKPIKCRRKAGTRLVVVTGKSARIVAMEQVLSLTERDMENNKAEARAPKMAVQTIHFIRQGKQQYAKTATREKLGDVQEACEHLRGVHAQAVVFRMATLLLRGCTGAEAGCGGLHWV